MKNEITIKCPYCGAEYLPAEIYIPKNFFGKPFDIERDYNHKIIDYYGTSVDNKETYTCDYCNKTFKVFAKIDFTTSKNEELNVQNMYKTVVKKDLF